MEQVAQDLMPEPGPLADVIDRARETHREFTDKITRQFQDAVVSGAGAQAVRKRVWRWIHRAAVSGPYTRSLRVRSPGAGGGGCRWQFVRATSFLRH